jgi:hypothetical protein
MDYLQILDAAGFTLAATKVYFFRPRKDVGLQGTGNNQGWQLLHMTRGHTG